MISLLLALALSQAPDAGSDAPTLDEWSVLPPGAVLRETSVCGSEKASVTLAKNIAATRAERDAALQEVQSGGGSTVRWAMISLAIGFSMGGLAAAVGICSAVGCGKK